MKTFDAIIIGAGQAGVPLAKKLARAGKKVALIEKKEIGGVCVNEGCTPTKTLIASARMAYLASKSQEVGIRIKKYKVDFKKVIQRKDQVVRDFKEGAEKGLEDTPNLKIFYATASFKDAHTLNLQGEQQQELKAEEIFINVGGTPVIPPIEGLSQVDFLLSDSILHLKKVPKHLLIVGGGYIGLEYGQMFRRFGARVTILEEAPTLMPHEDDDVCQVISDIFQQEGITVKLNAKAIRVESDKKQKIVSADINGLKKQIKCTHLLIATGRKPNTEGLNLQAAGIQSDEKGYIKVNQFLRTNLGHIHAMGDVTGHAPFTHVAYNDYIIISKNILENARQSTRFRVVPYCMFTDPQLGRIGLTEKEAKAQGLDYSVAKIPMRHVARAIETGDIRGFMKAIVDNKSKKILGAAILGEEGGEIMSVLQMAMMGNITYDKIRNNMFAHPLYAESLNNLFMSLDS